MDEQKDGSVVWFFTVLAVVLWVGLVSLAVAAIRGPQDAMHLGPQEPER